MEKEIAIHYKATFEELYKVSKYILFRSKFILYIAIGAPILILINILSTSSTNKELAISEDIYPMLAVPLIWGFIIYSSLKSIKKRIQNNTRSFEDIKITFNHKCFIQEGTTFKIETFWKDVFKLKETKEWYLLFLNQNTAIPLFKEKLTEEELKDLKVFFNSLNLKKDLL